VRRSPPLQKTRLAGPPVAWVSPALHQRLGLLPEDFLRVTQNGGEAVVPVGVDERLPDGCVRLATAQPETARLGAMFGAVSVERIPAQQKVAV
jgi:NADH-quinone oxidoreductase subunit G